MHTHAHTHTQTDCLVKARKEAFTNRSRATNDEKNRMILTVVKAPELTSFSYSHGTRTANTNKLLKVSGPFVETPCVF